MSEHLISISRLRVRAGAEVSVQAFRGAVRGLTCDDFRARLQEAGERSPYLVVNLAELDYICSTGLGCLLKQMALQERRGGWLRIVSPSRSVAMILDVSGLAGALATHPSEDAALHDLPARAA